MRREKRWRYYCDHCKKSGGSSYHMKRHENGCTLNPERTCGLCEQTGQDLHPHVIKFATGLMQDNSSKKIKELRDSIGSCPACILSVLRRSGMYEEKENPVWIDRKDFDYQKEHNEWWAEENSARLESSGYY